MNDRVRELAKEAGAMFDHMTWVERDLAPVFDRFAELIVRECAGICDAYGMPDGTSQTAMILSRAIKNKFGVK